MRKYLFIALLVIPMLMQGQFNSRMRMGIRKPGISAGGGGPLTRNGIVMSSTFEGTVQCAYCKPADGGTPYPQGWNSRSGDYLDSLDNFQSASDTAVRKWTADSYEGAACLQLQVNKTDPLASSSIRSEVTPRYVSDAGDMWYGYAMKWVNWVKDATSPEHIWQWHPSSGTGSATLRLETHDDNYIVVYGNSDSAQYYLDTGVPIVNGVWTSVVWHVVWSSFGSIVPG